MSRYRFITPHRTGKWYPDLETAQRHACEIGAGFLDKMTGKFVAYVETVLEEAGVDRIVAVDEGAHERIACAA